MSQRGSRRAGILYTGTAQQMTSKNGKLNQLKCSSFAFIILMCGLILTVFRIPLDSLIFAVALEIILQRL